MLSALCNIFIDNADKLAIFQDTFPVVFPVSDNWLVYIRGKYRNEAVEFIKKVAKDRSSHCIFFDSLDDNRWIVSTKHILKKAKYKKIFIFGEDHLLIRDVKIFKGIVADMHKNNIDYFSYSFFGQGINCNAVEIIENGNSPYFKSFELTSDYVSRVKKLFPGFYPFSLPCVCSMEYLNKILKIESQRSVVIPFLIQGCLSKAFGFRSPKNRACYFFLNNFLSFFGVRIRIFSPRTPFNTERSIFDVEKELMPIKVGILKEELFGCIEDDNTMPNSSLIKRGLYPPRLEAIQPVGQSSVLKRTKYVLKPNEKVSWQYHPFSQRVGRVPLRHTMVIEGQVDICGQGECHNLIAGKDFWSYANIPHQISSNTGATIVSTINEL